MNRVQAAHAGCRNEHHCAELHYAYCRSTEHLRAGCHGVKYIFELKLVLIVVNRVLQGVYAGCHNEDHCAEWHYAYCHSAERLCAECHGDKYISE